MSAQPSQPPRWRASRGPVLVSGDQAETPSAPPTQEQPHVYYPGGPNGGYYSGGPQGPDGGEPPGAHAEPAAGLDPVNRKPPSVVGGGVALVMLGLWVAWVVFPWTGDPPKSGQGPLLPMLGALLSLGSGFHLLVNGVAPSNQSDTKGAETLRNVAIICMVLGALLGALMLTERNQALLLPSVLMSFILFIFGFVILLRPRK